MSLRLQRLLDTTQLLNQIETAEALAAFQTRMKDRIERARFARIASVLVDFRERLAKGALSGPAARPS
jgi:hypothetical protein